MVTRQIVGLLALALIAFLVFLTVRGIMNNGVDALALVSLLVLAILGFGVFGALWSSPDD